MQPKNSTNCLIVASLFVGDGPGGLSVIDKEITLNILSGTCIPGSNHGGNMSNPERGKFQVGGPYDKENLTTFRGGSGGEALSFQYLSFLSFFF